MNLRECGTALLLVSSLACGTVGTQTSSGTEWRQWANVAEAGFDADALEAARETADQARSGAVMVVYRGRVLAAWGDVARKLELHSVRKSLYSAMWGIAEEKGLVDLEATLGELGIGDIQGLTTREKQARLIDLLHARSGVYHPAAYASADDEEDRPARGTHDPDTFFYYNNWDFNVAGAMLERVSGKPFGTLFDEWIATPLGMEDFDPSDVYPVLEPGQSQWPALTIRMSTRDLARFGQMWLDRGVWNGSRVLPDGWVERASEPASTYAPGRGYAAMWWTYASGAVSAEDFPHVSREDVILGKGTGGQALFIIPGRDLVVVHRGDTDHGRSVGGAVIWGLVDRILGAQVGETSAAPKLVALQPVPLESQLPELVWPVPLEIGYAEMNELAGEYEFGPGIVGRVFVAGGRLFAYMPGEGEAELFALGNDEFFLRVDPTVGVRFERNQGEVERVVFTLKVKKFVGKRLDR